MMNSFYEQPRKAPQRAILNASRENIVPNLVPDASMLQQNKGNICTKRNEMSYNAWKHQLRNVMNVGKATLNKENRATKCPQILCSTADNNVLSNGSLLRKQVRFESPIPNQPIPGTKSPNLNITPPRPALVNRHFIHNPNTTRKCNKMKDFEPLDLPKPEKRHILPQKPFEKMYLANFPNRKLDLSLIEPPRPGFKHTLPQIVHTNAQVPLQPFHLPQKAQIPASRELRQEHELEIAKPQETKLNEEPSVKDLLKIIQQQNEQMIVLQKQVSSLMNERSQQPMLEAPAHLMNTPIIPAGIPSRSPNSNKFAIDVMTSFEVSIRPPPMRYEKNGARITELSASNLDFEDRKIGKENEVSLKLDEPLVVHERCPSPTESIHVDMQDYSSEDDDDDDGRSSKLDSSMIGWTIYNNVMEQVNYVMKRSTQNEVTKGGFHPRDSKTQEVDFHGGHLMQHVKDVTLKHLQNAGIHFNNKMDELKLSESAMQSPTEISFAVKQLLMKYLPDEKLSNMATRQPLKATHLRHTNYPKNAITRRPEFSVATMQYMEKYNLLKPTRKAGSDRGYRHGGMLDIAPLKQQPKLL